MRAGWVEKKVGAFPDADPDLRPTPPPARPHPRSAGYTFGLWSGALAAHGVRTTLVTPRAWKSEAGLDGTDKEASRLKALAAVGRGAAPSLARKKDHGRAEAMLIALWRANGGGGAEVAPEPEAEASLDGGGGGGGDGGEPGAGGGL